MRTLFACVMVCLSLTSSIFAAACEKGWTAKEGVQVTGYYTPIQTDFPVRDVSEFVFVELGTFSSFFPRGFVEAVKIQAWGKLRDGRTYIGYWEEQWQILSLEGPLDVESNPLSADPKRTTIAVDPTFIPLGATLMIPDLPSGWGERIFVASDIGPAIVGAHIDVYTGEGKGALAAAFEITGESYLVCIRE